MSFTFGSRSSITKYRNMHLNKNLSRTPPFRKPVEEVRKCIPSKDGLVPPENVERGHCHHPPAPAGVVEDCASKARKPTVFLATRQQWDGVHPYPLSPSAIQEAVKREVHKRSLPGPRREPHADADASSAIPERSLPPHPS